MSDKEIGLKIIKYWFLIWVLVWGEPDLLDAIIHFLMYTR